jgi:uncharacterized coiled-coil protein SlyX
MTSRPDESAPDALTGRVVELEIRVAFQDELLRDLDDVVRALRAELEQMRHEHSALVDSLEAHSAATLDEKPPHY